MYLEGPPPLYISNKVQNKQNMINISRHKNQPEIRVGLSLQVRYYLPKRDVKTGSKQQCKQYQALFKIGKIYPSIN